MPGTCAGDKRLDEWVLSSRISGPAAQLDTLAPHLSSLPSLGP